MVIILLILIVLICAYIIARMLCPVRMLEQYKVNELYRLLSVMDDIFTRSGVMYTVACGTLLGAVRDGGLIPWDNDADIAVPVKYFSTVMELKPEFAKQDIYIREDDHIWRIGSSREDNVYIDMYILENDEKGDYVYQGEENTRRWPKEYITQSEMFPLKRYSFGPLKLAGLNDVNSYLTRVYGSTWRTPVNYAKAQNLVVTLLTYGKKISQKCALPDKDFSLY